jgi:hypothetical protein
VRYGGALTKRIVGGLNACVSALHSSPRWGRLIRRRITVVTYIGRRSGRMFRIPVGYQRAADAVTIGVQLPDAKTWWRNFTGTGGPISLQLDGIDHTGHAVARRDASGHVTVTVQLNAPQRTP